MNWVKKVIIFVVILIILSAAIWVWVLDCKSKCKVLTLFKISVPDAACEEKEKCFGIYTGRSKDCLFPQGCCCYHLEK